MLLWSKFSMNNLYLTFKWRTFDSDLSVLGMHVLKLRSSFHHCITKLFKTFVFLGKALWCSSTHRFCEPAFFPSHLFELSALSLLEDEPTNNKETNRLLTSLELYLMAVTWCVMQYDSPDSIVVVESACWLLMAWHLFGARTSANIMMT